MRFWRVMLAWTMVVTAVAGIITAAALADGRTGSASETNDGGAWLLNRSVSSIGHVNRVVGELDSTVGPFGGDFEVTQARDVVVVVDRSAGEAVLIDTNLSVPGAPVRIPSGTEVHAVPSGVVLYDATTGRVWRVERSEFGAIGELDDLAPLTVVAARSALAVGLDGRLATASPDGASVISVAPDGTVDDVPGINTQPADESSDDAATRAGLLRDGEAVVDVTLVDETLVLLTDAGDLIVVSSEPRRVDISSANGTAVTLAQPSLADATSEPAAVVVVTDENQVMGIDLESGDATLVGTDTADDATNESGTAATGDPTIRPISHDGCVWSVSVSPATFHFCGRSHLLAGASDRIELTLVNGWVWVNDVDRGGIWFVQQDDLAIREISDWTAALLLNDEEETDESLSGGDEELVTSAGADDLADDVDRLDDDDRNEAPVAEDDEVATRRGRPVLIDVLANDIDPDNDPLSIERLLNVDADGRLASGASVSILADDSAIQLIPPADFVGDVSFGYAIHDGRQGRDEAQVRVRITPPDEATNRPPTTEIDNATVRAGRSVALNVLSNDSDPDGDVLVLIDADDLDGAVNFTPDGQLSFSPDLASPDGTIDIGYRVSDDFGAEATGTARIRVRNADSNQRPEARNDIGHTSVGKSVVLDVLANDADPDGDPIVAQNLQSTDGAPTEAQLAPDGQFLFRPETPGTFRFTYAVSDGPTVDQAQIRITVDPPAENRPPIAVLDEVALAIGESRLVRVLDNDGDPDGDIVGLVDWVGADGLEITEVPGVGFNVLATVTASPRTEFRYWISDGLAEPVRGSVIVSALQRDAVDYPPVAVVDTVDVRAGTTNEVQVLRNDYDPEGRFLQIVAPVTQPPEARVRVSPTAQSLLLTVDADQRFGFQFSYDVADPAGNRASAIVQVRVVPPTQPNRAPVASPDIATTLEAVPVAIAVRSNDFDPDGDPITVESIAEQPTNGSVTLDPEGFVIYTPAEGFTGTDRFVYTLVDGYQPPADTTLPADQRGPGRDLGEVLIGVMPASGANRDPIAVDDTGFAPVRIGADPLVLDVLDNDSDPDGDIVIVTATSTVAVGSVTIGPDGRSVVYTPPGDGDARVVSFSYTIADGRGGEASAQVTLQLDPAPEPIPPVAVDDTVGPVTPGTVITLDPTLNDFDPDGDRTALEVESASPNLTVTPAGTVRITAPAATAEVEYSVRDEQGELSEPAFITVLVADNQAPVIAPINVETAFNTPVTIALADAVTDPDGDQLVITLGAQRSGGSVAIANSGQGTLDVVFTPDTDVDGAAAFDFLVDDRNGHTVSGSASITVLPSENREPVAAPSSVTAQAGIDTLVRLSDLVTDPDGGDGHQYTVGSPSGAISVGAPNARGEVTIGSAVDAGGGSASFDYTVIDGEFTVSNTVSVDLIPAEFAPPTVAADSVRILQGSATPALAVLDNDVDNIPAGLAGSGLRVVTVGVSPNGTTQLQGNRIVFTPTPEFFGTASFTYTVQDGRRSEAGEASGTVIVDVIGRPDAPQPPSVDSVGSGYLVIGWAAPQGNAARAPVTGYTLRYTASDGTVGEQVFSTPSTSHRWDGLTNAVEYCFQVSATNEAGTGELSGSGGASSCGVPDVRPEAPAAPIVDFGNQQLSLAWSTPLNQGTPINSYQVRISGGLQSISGELGVTNSYVWESLVNGTDYTFEVRARNSSVDNDGWSDWSPLSSPEHPLTRPAAPNRPGAERGDRQVRVTWQAPDDGGDSISRYQVQSSISSTWVDVTPQGTSNAHVWENIPNGTDVSFRVRAVNRDPGSTTPGNISQSSPIVRACSVPDAPQQPTVERGDTQVTVRWQPPADQGCAISSYQITSANGTQTASASATSHVYTGLTNGQSYTFTVTAVNEVVTVDGVAARPSAASAAAIPAGRPFVSNVTAATNTGPRQVAVTWSTADPNGSPVLRYELQVNGGAWTDVGPFTSITRTEGADGAAYTYRVRAENAIGASTQIGSTRTVTTWNAPGTPSVNASAGVALLDASWTTPSTGGTALTGHHAKLVTGSCVASGNTGRANAGSPERWTGLSNGTTYRACVRYQNAVGWGPWGSATATPTAPAPSVTAFWGASAQGRPGCTSASCRYLNATGFNFTPGATVSVTCWGNHTGSWTQNSANSYSRTVQANGQVSFANVCYYGFTGTQARVNMNAVQSEPITS